jgi:hypothetical protein
MTWFPILSPNNLVASRGLVGSSVPSDFRG